VVPSRLALAALLVVGACSYTPPDAPGGGDAASPPAVAFEFPTSGTDEGASGATGTTALIPVLLSKASDTTVTVECTAIQGGTATELIDYEVATHTVTFAPGVTRVDVVVDVIKDFDEAEREETIELALSSPIGASLDADRALHEVTIADHTLPRIRFGTATSTTDEGTQTVLELQLDLPADGASTVVMGVAPMATTGVDSEDLALLEGTVIEIPSGATTVQVPIGEVNDPYDEPPTEGVTFELKGASQNLVVDAQNKTRAHSITDNDDPPVIQFTLSTSDVVEGVGTATLEVELTEESQLPITIDYQRVSADTATADDATVSGNSLSFAPRVNGVAGDTLKTISVAVVDDNSDEDPETVIVSLDNAPSNATLGGRTTHTMTILGDANDPPSVVEFALAASNRNESNATHSVTINVTPASGKAIGLSYMFGGTASFSGSGNGQDDYDTNTQSPFTIPAGSATFTFRVDINDDSANEGAETITIQLASPNNATLGTTSLHTVTINASN
jgi:hypothetical protein